MSSLKSLNPKAEHMSSLAALFMNIQAARGLHDVMRSNLGPKGTIKMLVGGSGGTWLAVKYKFSLCSRRLATDQTNLRLICRHKADQGRQCAAARDADTEPDRRLDCPHRSCPGRHLRVLAPIMPHMVVVPRVLLCQMKKVT